VTLVSTQMADAVPGSWLARVCAACATTSTSDVVGTVRAPAAAGIKSGNASPAPGMPEWLAERPAAAYRFVMMVAQQPILLGVIWYVLIAFSPLPLLWLAWRVPRVLDAIRDRRAARLRANRAQGYPLERLAADLRRLRSELINDPQDNYVRRTALLMAYDSVLRDTCARLEIPTELATAAPGPDLELERLRAESAIQEAGVSLRVPRRRAQP
jgi:hypothetical protein